MKIKFLLGILILGAFVSCKKKDEPTDPTNNQGNGTTTTPTISKLEALVRHWKIDSAFHDGVKDISSTGKDILFKPDGSHVFDGSLDGTWEFSPDSTRLYIDKALSYPQTWTIKQLDASTFDVIFNSPFTGKASRWKMIKK